MEIEYSGVQKKAELERVLGLLLPFGCCVALAGAAFDKWTGETAFLGMAVMVLCAVLYMVKREIRPISEIYALAIVLGMVGLSIMLVSASVWLVIAGIIVCGTARWAVWRIERKDWLYARK